MTTLNSISFGKNFKKAPHQEPKNKNRGFLRAQTAGAIVTKPVSMVVGTALINKMRSTSLLTQDETKQLIRSARKGLRDTGLYEKGTNIIRMSEIPIPEKLLKGDFYTIPPEEISSLCRNMFKFTKKDRKAARALQKGTEKSPIFRILLNKVLNEKQKSGFTEGMENGSKIATLNFKIGMNACFEPASNKIIIPDKHMQTSVFHEMGHALNYNGGGILKGLQKIRPLAMFLPAAILLISLLNKRKVNDESKIEDSKIQKGKDFVKKNAGKLTFLSMMPVIAEEAIASLRGQKIANNLVQSGDLSKELFKKIKTTNLLGLSSYVFSALMLVATAKIAIKVKDYIQAKHEAKQAKV